MSADDELFNQLFKTEATSQLEKLIAEVIDDPLARAKIRAKIAERERKTETLSPEESAARFFKDLDAIADRSPALAEVIGSLDPAATKTLLMCQKATLAWLKAGELCDSVRQVIVEHKEEAVAVLDKVEALAKDANKLKPLVYCYLYILARCAQVDFSLVELLDALNDRCFEQEIRDAVL